MKKTTLLLAIVMALFSVGVATTFAAQVPSYFINETFDGLSAIPTGWTTVRSPYGNTGIIAPTITSNMLQYSSASASANRGLGINIPTSGAEQIVYLDFDWQVGSPITNYRNAGLLMFHDNTTATAPKDILGLYLGPWGETNVLHCWNMKTADTAAFIGSMQTYPSFNRANTLAATNAGTITTNNVTNLGNGGTAFSTNQTYNVKATLDFTTHQVTYLKITKLSDNTFVEKTNLPFIDNTAATVGEISFTATRSSNAGNGGNSGWTTQIDNLKIYKLIEASVANVTINFLDPLNNPIKTARTQADQIVGTTYTAIPADKDTYTDGTFYYVYDAVSTTSDNVVVAEGGSTINLKFTKIPVVAGTYTWTGITSGNWNDSEANFTTDGSNSLAYQNANAIIFPASATQKTISITKDLNLGSQSINLSGDGYILQGTGSITGSKAALNLNLTSGQTATLNFINNLDSVVVNGGTAVISNDASGKKYVLADGAKLTLQTGAGFSKPIIGSGTINIEAVTNVFYWSTITGASTINYMLGAAGTYASSNWSNQVTTVFPACTLNVTTTTGVASGFGVADGSLTNAKVNLGDNVRLFKSYNQNSGAPFSTIVVGELSGTAGSTLEGGFVAGRTLNYNVGGLNTDATFAGTIKNYIQASDILNIYKKGTGIWTLTGASTLFTLGSFNVDAGKVIVNGTLGSTAVPVTVAAAGTLSGTGTIAGVTTVNGTLEGRLNFGSSLILTDTTNLVVDGFASTQYDSITVVGAVTMGGVLNVTVNAAAPAVNTSIKLIKAGSYAGSFTTKNLPAHYTFDAATGILTYDLGTKLSSEFTNKLSIYPTLTHDFVNISGVNASTVELVNLTGQVVKQVSLSNGKTTINMNGLSTGAYFVKVRSTDGSVNIQKVIYQK